MLTMLNISGREKGNQLKLYGLFHICGSQEAKYSTTRPISFIEIKGTFDLLDRELIGRRCIIVD